MAIPRYFPAAPSAYWHDRPRCAPACDTGALRARVS